MCSGSEGEFLALCDGWHGSVGLSDEGVAESESVDEIAEHFAVGEEVADGLSEEALELLVERVHAGDCMENVGPKTIKEWAVEIARSGYDLESSAGRAGMEELVMTALRANTVVERARCAKIADDDYPDEYGEVASDAAVRIARKIRDVGGEGAHGSVLVERECLTASERDLIFHTVTYAIKSATGQVKVLLEGIAAKIREEKS